MGSYYYLGAQLPYLVYGQIPPMSSADFKALAREQMSSVDAAVLARCTLDPDAPAAEDAAHDEHVPTAEFIANWKEWERTLRLNLARGRAGKLRREGPAESPELPVDAVSAAKNALALENPLEAELLLDKARWDAIESFQGIDSFSESAMYAYLLKLLLMERRTAFKTETGFTEYKGLYAAILGNSSSYGEAK